MYGGPQGGLIHAEQPVPLVSNTSSPRELPLATKLVNELVEAADDKQLAKTIARIRAGARTDT